MSENTMSGFAHSSQDMIELIKQELSSARNDAERVSGLIADSASVLQNSFRNIGDVVGRIGENTEKNATDAQATVQSINEAVQALQFEDVSLQLLAHLSRRLNDLAALMTAVESTLGVVEHIQGEEKLEAEQSLKALQDDMNALVKRLREQRDSPVGHDISQEGTVELF